MKSLSLFVFCILTLAAITPAHAGFRYLPSGSTPEATSSAVVEGFADQVPLTVALRQVLPRGTVFSIADSVDVQSKVSWRGGQPWRNVLDTTLANAGLRATYSNNMVRVDRAGASAPMPSMAMNNAPIRLTAPSAMPADAPIKLQPPVVLTPPPAAAPIAPQNLVSSTPIVQGEVTSLDPDAGLGKMADVTGNAGVQQLGTTKPSAPLSGARSNNFVVADDFNGKTKPTTLGEITSMDADIKAEVANGAPAPVPSTLGTLGTLGMMPVANTGTSMPTDTASVPYGSSSQWEAKPGQMLRDVLLEWGARAGVEVNWQSEYDYPVQASLSTTGTFEEAVRTLLYGFRDANPQPVGRLHKNDQVGQQVLLITVRGATNEQ